MISIQTKPVGPEKKYDREYSPEGAIGGPGSTHPFRQSLRGIAVGPGDALFALGDGEVRVFEPRLQFVRSWRAPDAAACLAIAPDGKVYVGAPGRVSVHDPGGDQLGGFAVSHASEASLITCIRVHQKQILVADASARVIRRFDPEGKELGPIGTQHKTGSFMLPNRSLDFDVDAKGTVYAADSGRHQVSSWSLDGTPLGRFGKFGQQQVEDFVGCCNPVNLAVAPDGKIVVAEKVAARVKVYEPDGRLLSVIGPGPFDPMCTFIRLAVDSRGRIFTADPVRREIKVFSPVAGPGSQARPGQKPTGS